VLLALGTPLVLVAGGNVVAASATGGLLYVLTTLPAAKLYGLRPAIALNRTILPEVFEFIGGGFPFLFWQLTLIAHGQIDKVLIGAYLPVAEVAWYAAAERIVGVVVFIPTLVIAPLVPALSRTAHDPAIVRRTIAQTIRLLLVLIVGLAVGTVVIAPIIPALFGWPADFERAVPLMTILALHEPIVAIDMVLGVVLNVDQLRGTLGPRWRCRDGLQCGRERGVYPALREYVGQWATGASVVTALTEAFMLIGAPDSHSKAPARC
jgi:O-antigen/teichoic acid export membrane protein